MFHVKLLLATLFARTHHTISVVYIMVDMQCDTSLPEQLC